MNIRPYITLLVLFSILGIADTGYLSYKHAMRDPLTCSIIDGCDRVTTSPYSEVAGIPLAYVGTVFYTGMLVLSLVFAASSRTPALAYALVAGTSIGLAASLWFVYLQIFVIKAVCEYCMLSAFATLVLWIAGIAIIYAMRSKRAILEP